jgi:hypothetical protein
VRGVRYVSYGRYVRCVKDGTVLVLYIGDINLPSHVPSVSLS